LLQEFRGDAGVFSLAGAEIPTDRESVADSKLYVVHEKSCQFQRDALKVLLIHPTDDVRRFVGDGIFLRASIRSAGGNMEHLA
jgi:hypothetical protein